jgi:hypothetical protein
MLAAYPPWIGGLVAGGGAAFIWGTLTLIASFLKAPGKAIAEKNVVIDLANTKIRELEANRPRLSACLYEDSGQLLLSVTNAGAAAWVWATVNVSGNTLRQRSSVSAVWKHIAEDRSKLTMHETRDIIIAERKRDDQQWASLKYYWYVPFIENGNRSETRPLSASVPSHPGFDSKLDPEARAIRQDVSITVLSDPISLEPPIHCVLALVGCDMWEDVSGVQVCPQLSARSSASEELQRFAAEETEFTSDGLEWKTISSQIVKGTEFSGFVTTVIILSDQSLPQPLILRVRCSQEPQKVSASFYEDAQVDLKHPVPTSHISIHGKNVYVELREPRFKPSAALSLKLAGHSKISVQVERKVS